MEKIKNKNKEVDLGMQQLLNKVGPGFCELKFNESSPCSWGGGFLATGKTFFLNHSFLVFPHSAGIFETKFIQTLHSGIWYFRAVTASEVRLLRCCCMTLFIAFV